MLEELKSNTLEYKKLTQEEMDRRGILGRLVGTCADFIDPTRNGRRYDESLWEKVFSDPIMQEKITNGVCYGELGHPEDREEIDMARAAVCLAEVPKKGKDGKLKAVFDILSTPCGEILNKLCKYGSTLGVSSRGTGDTYIDENGQEAVDPSTYNCECFDIVCIPAVKSARLSYVNESLQNNNLANSLKESLDNASTADRKIMEEVINELGINLDNNSIKESIINNSVTNNANDAGNDMITELTRQVAENRRLKQEISDLQEKLSVSHAKETQCRLELEKRNSSIRTLSEKAKKYSALEAKFNALSEKYSNVEYADKKSLKESLSLKAKFETSVNTLNEQIKKSQKDNKSLREQLNIKEEKINSLNEQVSSLTKSMENLEYSYQDRLNDYQDEISELRTNSEIKQKEFSDKLTEEKERCLKYQKIANTAVNKYISSEAVKLGVSSQEIKNKLPENYSFEDINRICEELKSYKLNISKLPFDISSDKNVQMKISATTDIAKPSVAEDEVDNALMRYAGLV